MRALLRTVLTVVLLAVLVYAVFVMWPASTTRTSAEVSHDTRDALIATKDSLERGAQAAGRAAASVQETVTEAEISSKIKAKMALDDFVRARTIDVSTNSGTVTLRGSVRSAAEHDRAVALARETDGVKNVVDRLETIR